MVKPTTIKDLLLGDHISKSAVKKIAQTIFNGETTATFPELEGYVVTAVKFDNLPEGTKQHIVKAVLEFKIENVLDLPLNALKPEHLNDDPSAE